MLPTTPGTQPLGLCELPEHEECIARTGGCVASALTSAIWLITRPDLEMDELPMVVGSIFGAALLVYITIKCGLKADLTTPPLQQPGFCARTTRALSLTREESVFTGICALCGSVVGFVLTLIINLIVDCVKYPAAAASDFAHHPQNGSSEMTKADPFWPLRALGGGFALALLICIALRCYFKLGASIEKACRATADFTAVHKPKLAAFFSTFLILGLTIGLLAPEVAVHKTHLAIMTWMGIAFCSALAGVGAGKAAKTYFSYRHREHFFVTSELKEVVGIHDPLLTRETKRRGYGTT